MFMKTQQQAKKKHFIGVLFFFSFISFPHSFVSECILTKTKTKYLWLYSQHDTLNSQYVPFWCINTAWLE